jgi:lipopolysaccharide/colanic/teichoic acid biosynthesis glycosyltransferase
VDAESGVRTFEMLQRIIDFIFSFKAYVMLPAVMLVVALAIRMKVGVHQCWRNDGRLTNEDTK